MSNINVGVQVSATIVLTETEIRALDALVGYGIDSFLTVFYEKLGEHYMKPHESGLRSLFENIQQNVRPAIHEVDWHRKTLRSAITELAEKRSAKP